MKKQVLCCGKNTAHMRSGPICKCTVLTKQHTLLTVGAALGSRSLELAHLALLKLWMPLCPLHLWVRLFLDTSNKWTQKCNQKQMKAVLARAWRRSPRALLVGVQNGVAVMENGTELPQKILKRGLCFLNATFEASSCAWNVLQTNSWAQYYPAAWSPRHLSSLVLLVHDSSHSGLRSTRTLSPCGVFVPPTPSPCVGSSFLLSHPLGLSCPHIGPHS